MKRLITFLALLLLSAYTYATKPNVVIIYADDMGYGDVSYGDKNAKIQTPNLDALAVSGMKFTDGHSSSGICSPSRFAMLTGQHHWRRFHDIVGGFGESVFKADDFTLPKMFKAKGYKTAMVGKWHLGWNWQGITTDEYKANKKAKRNLSEKYPNARPTKYYPEDIDWSKKIPMGPTSIGFDYYFGDGTINYPPFTWIENDKVLIVPTKMVSLDDLKDRKEGGGTLVSGPMAAEGWGIKMVLPTITEKAVEYISKQSADEPFFLYFSLNAPHAPIVPADEFDGKSQAGAYGDFVVQLDDSAGRVIAELKRKGLYDNTIIIFSADNGAAPYLHERQEKFGHWSSGMLRGNKRDILEGGHRVPFIISWQGHIKPNSVTNELVSQVDLAATFAEIIGYDLAKNEAQDSFNILPILESKELKNSIRDFTIYNTSEGAFAFRQGDWVYMNTVVGANKHHIPNGGKINYDKNADGLLFNLADDIVEINNLYEQHPEKVKEMKALLDVYVKGKPTAPHAE